jgi:hypothetical protein
VQGLAGVAQLDALGERVAAAEIRKAAPPRTAAMPVSR